jgi:hypothetical protein
LAPTFECKRVILSFDLPTLVEYLWRLKIKAFKALP